MTISGLGCVDGPLYSLKNANPYYRAQWSKDRELGPTYGDRIAELDLLREQIRDMDPTKQREWANNLERVIKHDPSPEMRAKAVDAIAYVQDSATERALNLASGDDNEKVRLAACRAWRVLGGSAARSRLMTLAQNDSETTSVRQEAIESLAVFDDAEVRRLLARLLDDPSPAVQYQVAMTLKNSTGRDYGGDFEAWKKFLAGEDVAAAPAASMADKLWNALPSL
ncbi:MAG: HEAT repeat domain-containing protein [Planctomycetales bacterium]|nr:HEAT repeat domain-containing protein [Planctomycetales bacterium]